jgi:FSR family fosmidomycin resistance protein-like MFS transporter
MALVMLTQFSMFESFEKNKNRKKIGTTVESVQDAWGPFARLTFTVIGRSILFYGLNTFIPIYWINVLHESKAAGAMALTIFAGSGILGNLLGGNLADRFGQKKIILIGFFSLTLLLPILVWVHNPHLATFLLVPIGLTLYATYSPTVVLGQNYLPNHIGLSSGVTLGIAVAIGGGATPIIGRIADLYGIWFALAVVACLPVLTSAIALTLSDPKRMGEKIEPKEPLAIGPR